MENVPRDAPEAHNNLPQEDQVVQNAQEPENPVPEAQAPVPEAQAPVPENVVYVQQVPPVGAQPQQYIQVAAQHHAQPMPQLQIQHPPLPAQNPVQMPILAPPPMPQMQVQMQPKVQALPVPAPKHVQEIRQELAEVTCEDDTEDVVYLGKISKKGHLEDLAKGRADWLSIGQGELTRNRLNSANRLQ